MIDQKKARFEARMLNFARALVKPKIFEALEMARKGNLTYDNGRFHAEITTLEHLGFVRLFCEYEGFKLYSLTEKGEKLRSLLMDLAILVYEEGQE